MPSCRQLGAALLRWFVVYAVLCAGAYWCGTTLVQAMTPVFKAELEAWRPEYQVTRIDVERTTVSLEVKSTVRSGFTAQVDNSYQFTYPILVLSLLAAWPFRAWRRRLVALGMALGLLLPVMLADCPVLALLKVAAVTDHQVPFLSFLVDNGGRQFVALLILLVSVGGSGWVEQRELVSLPRRERRLRLA